MMHRIFAVMRRELSSSTASPSAWVFLVIFLITASFCAFMGGGLFATGQADLSPFFNWMPWLFLFLVPALTMPMWSEERRLGVFELTLSFPATVFELVFGKFAAGFVMLAAALLLTAAVPITALVLGKPDPGAILCGYAGALLLGAVYLSMSLFCSALSKSQTASFLLSVVLCGFFLFLGWPQLTALAERWIPNGILTALSSCAFIPNYQAFQKGVVDTSELMYCLVLSGTFLGFTCFSIEFAGSGTGSIFASGAFSDKAFRKAVLRFTFKTIYTIILAIGLNIVCNHWRLRFDVSSDRAYSISNTLKKLANDLKNPVTLRFYASTSHPSMPQAMRKYAERVQWLLQEFAAASKGKIRLVLIDPDPDSPDAEAAVMDGLKTLTDKMGERMFLGVSAGRAEMTAAIPVLSPANESMLEYELARIVLNVSREQKKKIGIMSALPVLGTIPQGQNAAGFTQRTQGSQQPLPPWYSMLELRRDYDLVQLPPDLAQLPQGLDAIFVIHPAGISSETVYALDQYLMRGGKMAVFLDPRSYYAVLKSRTDYAMMDRTESDFQPILGAVGIQYNKNLATADIITAYRKTLPDRMITNPMVLNLTPMQINQKNPITAGLNSVSMYFTGYFNHFALKGLKYETLLHTSPQSQPVSAMLSSRFELVLRNFRSTDTEYPLALSVQGKFHSAFPDKKAVKGHLKQGIAESELILFGDSDMLFNDVCIQRGTDAFGEMIWVRSNDNVTLLQNTAERLTGGSGLYSIRSRIPMSRPLTKINDLKAKAELKYKNRILVLERDFEYSMQRLKYYRKQAEKEGTNSKNLRKIKKEIRAITIKTTNAKRELKELKANLKHELNAMETHIRIINLILVPAGVALFGILWALFRHAKARRKLQ